MKYVALGLISAALACAALNASATDLNPFRNIEKIKQASERDAKRQAEYERRTRPRAKTSTTKDGSKKSTSTNSGGAH